MRQISTLGPRAGHGDLRPSGPLTRSSFVPLVDDGLGPAIKALHEALRQRDHEATAGLHLVGKGGGAGRGAALVQFPHGDVVQPPGRLPVETRPSRPPRGRSRFRLDRRRLHPRRSRLGHRPHGQRTSHPPRPARTPLRHPTRPPARRTHLGPCQRRVGSARGMAGRFLCRDRAGSVEGTPRDHGEQR